jgi:phage shock protein B
MEEIIIVPIVIGTLFLGLPWLIFHYITKWKQAATLTQSDEKLLDEMFEIARRLEDRVETVERLVADGDPHWKLTAPSRPRLQEHDRG